MSILHLSSLKKVNEPYVEDFIIKSQGQTFSSNYDWVSWMKKNLQFLCDDMFLMGFNKAEIKYRVKALDILTETGWEERFDSKFSILELDPETRGLTEDIKQFIKDNFIESF